MAIADWPAALPNDPLIEGYDEAFVDNIQETETDSGRPLRRARFSKPPRRPLDVPLALTRAEVAILETFFNSTLSSGVLPFAFTHPRSGAAITAWFRKGSPPRPKPDGSGVDWIVTLNLEVR